MKRVYLALALLGLVVPYYLIGSIILETGGFGLALFFQQALANNSTRLLAVDLTISVLAFWSFMIHESRRLGIRYWWAFLLLTGAVGLCCAVPTFLYVRQSRIEAVS